MYFQSGICVDPNGRAAVPNQHHGHHGDHIGIIGLAASQEETIGWNLASASAAWRGSGKSTISWHHSGPEFSRFEPRFGSVRFHLKKMIYCYFCLVEIILFQNQWNQKSILFPPTHHMFLILVMRLLK